MSSGRSDVASALDPERWRKIGGILTAVLDVPAVEREGALREFCAGDFGLVVEVRAYLEAHERTSAWLLGPVSCPEAEQAMAPGQMIGPYRVVSELGRGGMGEVVLAERADEVYDRRVAIKIIQRGMDSREIVRRFVRERRILANLDHAGIARLLDGGSTSKDRPYFVMEYIRGQPIDAYAREEGLSLRARLELFRKVCAAVDHAHRQLVVHRDLKPANILVDAQGEPKLLDFGIAKLLDTEAGWAETRTALRPMTLKYSSPEQLCDGVLTAAVDIHALGVLLYELLTGRHPYWTEGASRADLQQSICNQEPMLPSRAAAESSTQSFGRQLKGDIDAIVLHALRKEPLERYPSVASLDEDLRRHLHGEPVRAKKGSTWYRVSKFIRRNWRALAVLVAVSGLVALFVASTIRQSREVAKSAATAERTADFLVELFSIVDPSEARGQEITVREILDRGVERIETELVEEPEVRSALTHTMGEAYLGLGLYEAASGLLLEALETKERVHQPKDQELIETYMSLAVVHRNLGTLDVSERHARHGFALAEQWFGDEHAVVARAANVLALTLWNRGDLDSAEAHSRRSIAIARAIDDRSIVGPALNNLGLILGSQGRFEAAEEAHRDALKITLDAYGNGHPATMGAQNNLASVLIQQDRSEEAEPLFRQMIETRRRVLSDDHPDLATSLNNFAMLLHSLGRDDEAEPILREALEIYRRELGEDHGGVAMALHNLAVIRRSQGAKEEALSLYLESEQRKRKIEGDVNTNLARTIGGRADLMRELGDCAAAEPVFREAMQMFEDGPAAQRWRRANMQSHWGHCLIELDRLEEAEVELSNSLTVLEAARGPQSPRVERTLRRLARLYEAMGQPEKARAYRERLGET